MTRAALAAALLIALAAGRARAADIPADKRALIFLRVLAYDRSLARRAGGNAIRVGVLYRLGDAASERTAAELTAAITTADRSVANHPVSVLSLPYSDSAERDLARAGVAAVFVSQGLSDVAKRIAEATRKRSVLSFTQEESLVGAGLSIGLVRRGDRAVILVDLAAARAEGADLSAELLRVAEVVR